MGRYEKDPFELRVFGLESRSRTHHLGPGPLQVGKRRFWVDDVEVVIRYAVPTVWEPPRTGRRPPGDANPDVRR